MVGKLSKLGAGVLMTHWTRSRVDTEFLAALAREAGGDDRVIAAVGEANSARHAYELWQAAGLTAAPDLLCRRVADNLRRYVDGALAVDVVMVDFDGVATLGDSRR
jgi:cobalt-precorrin-5B (C1)-methyltransferase